jgi:5-methylcytosine-specific restriction endonuclease McrA
MTKICSYCGNDKLFKDFHKGNSTFNLKSQCILCCQRHYDPIKARDARRRHQQGNREDYRRRNSAYDVLHKAERAAREGFRRAQKLNATPTWLTEAQKTEILALYQLREQLSLEKGIIYHVDHIVPLINKDVCGLHVPWNLRVVTEEENLKKGNRV